MADYEDAHIAEMGYKPELRREFGFFHAFAISFADTSLIVAFYGVFAIALGAAGPTFFWGLLVVLAGQFMVSLILAEVASSWPLEGGVYQWTRKQTGARAGWFAAWAYWWTMVFAGTTCAYAASSFILPGIGINADKLTTIYLAIAVVLVGLAINAIAQSILKVFVSLFLIAELTTTVLLAIVLFFFFRVHGFDTLTQTYSTDGGFNWLWMGWFGAIAFMGWTFLGFDAAGAIAEEVHDPARNVPKAIVWVMVSIGLLTVFVTLASILAIPDIKAAMTGNIADPVIQTVTYHFGSGFDKPVLLLIAMGFIGSMVALHTAGSRTLYAMGRDRTIPGANFFTRLSAGRKLPVVALCTIAGVSIVILLVNIGASQVFTTLLSVAVVGFFISYGFVIVSQLILQFRGKHVAGPFTLGKASMAVTLVAAIWTVFELVNVWWPRSPSLPWYQNYGVIVVTVALAVLGIIAYMLAPRHEMSGHTPSSLIEAASAAGAPTE
ncbi:MAG TPA: amino acid permease [Candidatus Dormibacteraeota bacterium]|jgi:amino acid transporter